MTCFSSPKSLAAALSMALIVTLGINAASAQSQGRAERPNNMVQTPTDAPIVVELFTTADCEACPVADKLVYDTMNTKNVIALSCKIDSDDAVGVRHDGPIDPCSFRQWAYNATRPSSSTLAIPQIYVNSDTALGPNAFTSLPRTIEGYGFSPRNRALNVKTAWHDATTIRIQIPASERFAGENKSASIWLLRYHDMEVEKVQSGVNAGKVLRFSNVVQSSTHVGKWHGAPRSLDVRVPKPAGGDAKGGYVVLVQEAMGSTLLAAGRLPDYTLKEEQ